MNDVQPCQFEPEGILQDDSGCIEESRTIEESTRRTRNTNWHLHKLCMLIDSKVISLL